MDDRAVERRTASCSARRSRRRCGRGRRFCRSRTLPAGAPAAFGRCSRSSAAYGLGWALRDYRGRKMVYHTGTLAGYVSRTDADPGAESGVVVLTNQEEEGAHAAIAYTMVDQYLGAPPVGLGGGIPQTSRIEEAEEPKAVAKASGKRNAESKPSLPLAAYAGRYRDSWYGDILVENRGGRLAISFSHTKQLAGDLEHWQYDTFVARWKDRTLNADAYVTFALRRRWADRGGEEWRRYRR